MAYPIPANEAQRIEALRSYGILDSAPEIAYDDLTELAAQICGCPVAYITFIDEDRGTAHRKTE
jgi:adenylate cyclase